MADTLRSDRHDSVSAAGVGGSTTPASVGWARAVGASVVTLAILVVAFFYVPHWILTKLASPPRDVRVWLATGWMAFAFALACYSALRSTAKPSPARE